MQWAEAHTCHGEPSPAADPDAGDVRGHTVEDATVLSPKACDLQDSLGQQRVPVVGDTVNHQHSTPGPRTLSITDTAHHPATVPVSLSSSQTHSGTLTGGHTCNSSLSNEQPHTHLLTDSSITSGSTSHTDTQSQQSCRNTTPEAAGRPSSRPRHWTGPASRSRPPRAHLSLSVSMGTLFFSQVMRGLGSPWIWHWKRATPPSSPTVAWGCTWKSDMAGERKGGVHGGGTLPRSRGDGRGCGGLRSHGSAYPASYLWEHLPQRHSIGLAGH